MTSHHPEFDVERIVAALRELNARLRVHGMSDEEASALPSMLFTEALRQMEISTWRTDAGAVDIMADRRTRDGPTPPGPRRGVPGVFPPRHWQVES